MVAGKCFAAMRVGRAKPAPDVFLAAASSAGVAPADCVVLEDSALGVEGAVSAGMVCYGLDRHGDGRHLVEAGAEMVFPELAAFVEVLG